MANSENSDQRSDSSLHCQSQVLTKNKIMTMFLLFFFFFFFFFLFLDSAKCYEYFIMSLKEFRYSFFSI